LPESAIELYLLNDCNLSTKLVPTFMDRGCHVVSVMHLYGRILGFLDRTNHTLPIKLILITLIKMCITYAVWDLYISNSRVLNFRKLPVLEQTRTLICDLNSAYKSTFSGLLHCITKHYQHCKRKVLFKLAYDSTATYPIKVLWQHEIAYYISL
jgi:hypothetical protein